MTTRTTAPGSWKPPSLIESPYLRYGILALGLAYLVWSMGTLEIDWGRTARGFPRAGDMLQRMVPPDFSRWELLLRGIIESLEMAFAASVIGMVLAVPLAVCGARNLMPLPVYLVARSIIVLSRTFHEVIVAIYRLDANIRHSTVVGIVGAGGIGMTLTATFKRYDYDFSLAILLTIIALVFIGEVFSTWIRSRLR